MLFIFKIVGLCETLTDGKKNQFSFLSSQITVSTEFYERTKERNLAHS